MPAVSTNTSTLSGVAYCWSFQLMTTWNPARYVLLARSAGWTYARIPITWLKPLWLRSPFWFKQSLANFSSGLDAVVFIHLMVARGCCCWLGTVSLTINQSFLQPKTPRKHWGFLGFFLRCQFGDSAYTHPWGSQDRTPLLTPSFTRCIWCIRRDSTEPITCDARLAEDTHSLNPLCSNDLRARRSIGCLAPPLSCLRDLFSMWFFGWARLPLSWDGAIWLCSDKCSIASCFRYL